MRIELKQIVNQLTDAIGLPEGQKVSAVIDDESYEVVGWSIVNINEDGSIEPIPGLTYKTIKEMIDGYGKTN